MPRPRAPRSSAPTGIEPSNSSRAPAATLRRLGLRPRKGYSQSFLTDLGICRAIADDAELAPGDEVLEIGPGLGILTAVLAERAARVVAVELDPALAGSLPGLVPAANLEVLNADALQVDPTAHFAGPYKLVANLPYQITSPVLRRYLVEVPRPAVLVLMVQREVAERLTAPPGEASYLSIMAQSVAQVQLRRTVAPGAFYPRPKVTSAVIRLRPFEQPVLPDSCLPAFLGLVRAGFSQPRKTLANSLSQGLAIERAAAERLARAAAIDPSVRPQHVGVADWVRLFGAHAAGA